MQVKPANDWRPEFYNKAVSKRQMDFTHSLLYYMWTYFEQN